MGSWRDKIRKTEPYIPGEQPKGSNIIKLNTNENPYPPSPKVKEAIESYDANNLRLYPDFVCSSLKSAIAHTYGVNENEIFLGNGSDEVLAFCFMTFFDSDKKVLFPDITYSFYDVWCRLYDIPYERVPLDDGFNIVPEDYFKENGGVVIANPNAPTGIYMELEALEEIIKRNGDSIVIIDEAYIDFGGISAAELIHKYDNLAVVQTFSKSGALAGIRVGYAMANPELIGAMEAVKNSFNSYTLDSLSQTIAEAAARDREYIKDCCGKIIKTREWTVAELKRLGFDTLPSLSNFIFTTNKNIEARDLFKYLREQNIIVRYFDKPRTEKYLRITIGTQKQMEALIEAIRRY